MADDPSRNPTSERKLVHIRTSLQEDVSFPRVTTGLESYRFVHQALPEIDWADVDLRCSFLGHSLRAPVLISSMTGGAEPRGDLSPHAINLRLARAAQRFGLALGVGSQRAMLEDPRVTHTYQVRHVAPDILLFANLGAVQLNYSYGLTECRRAVQLIQADALILHLNPLQEYFQLRGNLNFGGLLGKIESLCRSIDVPVVVKEVGWGIGASTAQQLVDAGVAAVDVAGAGGTSWTEIEGSLTSDPIKRGMADTFADWGIPTAKALTAVREALPRTPVIASGGIRTGLDVAKAIAIGADIAGMAGSLLKAAHHSPSKLEQLIEQTLEELKLTMFVTGSAAVADLRRPGLLCS